MQRVGRGVSEEGWADTFPPHLTPCLAAEQKGQGTWNNFLPISSHLADFMAKLVSKNDCCQLVFRTIALKVQDDGQCVM